MGYEGEERRQTNEFRDPPTERGVKFTNYIASLSLLLIMGFGSWFGLSVKSGFEKVDETLKDIGAKISELTIIMRLQEYKTNQNTLRLDKHDDEISKLNNEINDLRRK